MRQEQEEEELVAALRRRDPDAFDAVFERYRARLFAFLARLSNDRTLAEDLMQETFLRLATRAADLTADTSIRAWLFATGRNLYVDSRRRAWLDLTRLRDLSRWPGTPSVSEHTPFDASHANEAQRRLERALSGVPAVYREAVLLVAVEGLTPSEAAAIVGVPDATLRKRLQRGRDILEKALTDA